MVRKLKSPKINKKWYNVELEFCLNGPDTGVVDPRNLSLKFGQNCVSNDNWYIVVVGIIFVAVVIVVIGDSIVLLLLIPENYLLPYLHICKPSLYKT